MGDNKSGQSAASCLAVQLGLKGEEKAELLKEQNRTRQDVELLLDKALGKAAVAQEGHHTDPRIISKAGRKTKTFTKNFEGFLQAYGGVIEVMRQADSSQTGGAAYSALSALLVVAVNKQRKEDTIDSTLLKLRNEFSRLKRICDIHPQDDMHRYIQDVYEAGLEFVEKATRYYDAPRWKRFLEAIFKPPQLGFDEEADNIGGKVSEVDRELRALDAERLRDTEKKVEGVDKKVRDLDWKLRDASRDIAAIHNRDVRQNLSTIQAKLVSSDYDEATIVSRYDDLLSQTFTNLQGCPPLDVEKLEDTKAFQLWMRSKQSRLLLLHGETVGHGGNLCWLSCFAVHLVRKLKAKKVVVAFDYCQQQLAMYERIGFNGILRCFIFQLIEANPSILEDQNKFQDLDDQIRRISWDSSGVEPLVSILQDMLESHDAAYLILDRVDQVKIKAWHLTKALSDLMKSTKCAVKLILIASSNEGFDASIIHDVQEAGGGECRGLELNQTTIEATMEALHSQ